MGRRHDDDAGGDPHLLRRKAALRERMWETLAGHGVARFPGAHGRIPNFAGAEVAAEQLRQHPAWQRARTLKANPDAPQWPVRQRALEDGKTVYMGVPRLADERPFLKLAPDDLVDTPRKASSIKGSARNARPVAIDALEPLDLVVTGCVAVGEDGARLGKGGGFSDLEFAVASEAGLIDGDTLVVTTVHDLQVLPAGQIPMTGHDVPVDIIVTPERLIDTGRPLDRPGGVRWGDLTDDKIAAIPLLQRLRARGR